MRRFGGAGMRWSVLKLSGLVELVELQFELK